MLRASRVTPAAVFLTAAALLGACHQNQPNPFGGPNATATPPPDVEIVFTSNLYAPAPGSAHDVYAVKIDGTGLTRLTFCNTQRENCDNIEAAPGPDLKRLAVRRAPRQKEAAGLVLVDLVRSVEGSLLPPSAGVTGVDWSAADEILAFSGAGEGGIEDLFRMDVNGQNKRALTTSANVRESRPRIDPSGNVAVFGRVGPDTKGEVWLFTNGTSQNRITAPGSGTELLTGTPFVVGSDADPAYSPDGRTIVFRRLVATTRDGAGIWDVMTFAGGAAAPETIATGPSFRGAPDWGAKGIVFPEADATGTRLVVVQPDGSGRRVPVTLGAGYFIDYPRWFR
jgi:dipeptidyl aminopeptidase/acylaminoacyl peptidase